MLIFSLFCSQQFVALIDQKIEIDIANTNNESKSVQLLELSSDSSSDAEQSTAEFNIKRFSNKND